MGYESEAGRLGAACCEDQARVDGVGPGTVTRAHRTADALSPRLQALSMRSVQLKLNASFDECLPRHFAHLPVTLSAVCISRARGRPVAQQRRAFWRLLQPQYSQACASRWLLKPFAFG